MTEPKPIRWLDGCFRGVSAADMNIDARIVKALFRRGERLRNEGDIANYVDLFKDSEQFQASLSRLEQFKLIEVTQGFSSRRVKLLAVEVAAELIGKDQIAEQDEATKEYKRGIERMSAEK